MNAAPQLKKHFSYADYCNWPEDERWELIDGTAFNMSPAPTRKHQKVAGTVFRVLADYLDDKPCDVYFAPFDVILSDEKLDELIDTVVQPDLVVTCDEAKFTERGYKGAPALVVEILSESTASRDLNEKYFLYQKSGVQSYLVVNPWSEHITVHELDDSGKYGHPATFAKGDLMSLTQFPGLKLNLTKVFS